MDPSQQAQQIQQEPQKATGANKYLQPYKSRWKILIDNFLGGIAWSLGTFVGLGLLAVIVGYVISKIDLIPILGTWIAQIMNDATFKLQPPI